ncbi:MAG: hypothetical protein AABN33_19395 [Acidobacteriota bacterium]
MATTPVAQRRSRDNVSARKALGRGRDWRQVLLSQDAEAIWHELSTMVRTAMPDHADGYEQLTQELFLHLLATDRVSFYLELEQKYSDSEIREDLMSILCG